MNESRRPARFVVLDGRRVGYTIRESRTARRCRIRVTPAGVEVVVPRGAGEERAAAFLRANAAWVLDQFAFQDRMRTVRARTAPAPDTLLLRGREKRVEIVRELSRRRYAIIEEHEEVICVRVPDREGFDPQRALEAWLRRQARADIAKRLAERTAQMKRQPGRVYVMGQRTKWGSCSRRRNLSFNWRLVLAPPEVLDYLVVHELAHLIEPYHSARFWLVVRSHCPEFQRWRNWLRDHQERLGLPG